MATKRAILDFEIQNPSFNGWSTWSLKIYVFFKNPSWYFLIVKFYYTQNTTSFVKLRGGNKTGNFCKVVLLLIKTSYSIFKGILKNLVTWEWDFIFCLFRDYSLINVPKTKTLINIVYNQYSL